MPVADIQKKDIAKSSPSKRLFVIVYATIFPLLIMLMALFFVLNDIHFVDLPSAWFPNAQIIVIVLSLFSIIFPWLIQKRMSQNQASSPTFNVFWLGLGLSVIPAIYGFVLFTMGASMIELGFFAIASSLAAIIWSIKTSVEKQETS